MLARFERQTCLEQIGVEGQKKLAEAKVLVVGLGGLGCPVSQYLTAAGVGHLRLVDGDVVSLNNLQRQILFSESEIGEKKVEIAKRKLQALDSRVEIQAVPNFIDTENVKELVSTCDVVVDATDNFYTKYLLNDACYELNIPLVLASILRFSGQIGVFCGECGPSYREVFPDPPDSAPTCSEAGILGPVCGVIGSLQATEVIKLIAGVKENLLGRLLVIDLLTYKFSSLEIERSANLEIKSLQDEQFYQNYKLPVCDMTEKIIDGIIQITAKELVELRESNSNLQIVDVREEFEREICSIGGEHIPLGLLPTKASELSKEKKTVVYCKAGGRSQKACLFLIEELGFSDVTNLAGGILGYQEDVDKSLSRY